MHVTSIFTKSLQPITFLKLEQFRNGASQHNFQFIKKHIHNFCRGDNNFRNEEKICSDNQTTCDPLALMLFHGFAL